MTSDTGAGQKPVIDGETPSAADTPPPAVEWTASDKRGPLETAEEREARASAAKSDLSKSDLSKSDLAKSDVAESDLAKSDLAESDLAAEASKEEAARAAEALSEEAHVEPAPTPTSDGEPVRPAAEASPEPVAPSIERPRRSIWPIAAALVLGAGVGAGSAILVQTPFAASLLGQPVGGAAPAVADLSNRVNALEKRPDAEAAVSGLRGALADLDSKVAALQKTSAERQGPGPTVDLKPLDQKIAALEAELASVKSQASAAQGDKSGIDAQLTALKKEVDEARDASAAAKSGVTGLKDEQKTIAAAAVAPALAVVADSLVRQVHEGAPYTAQVDALTSLGADPARVSVLREHAATGVASARTLAAKFSGLATPLAALAHKAPPNAGFVDKLKAGMFNLVTVRRVGDSNDTDLASRVSRIEADLAHDDVVGAYGTWSALPDEAKTKSAEFGTQIKASAETLLAARAVQHDAIVGLGRKS